MPIIVLLVVVAAIGAVAVVLAGRTGGEAEFEPDRPPFALPDGELVAPDVDAIRFSVGVRGYRMDQVDAVLDRLARELADRDEHIARLEDSDGAGATGPIEPVATTDTAGPAEPAEPAEPGGLTNDRTPDRG